MFNQRFPTGLAATRCGATSSSANGIALFSWAGSSVLTNVLDVSDPDLGIASLFYSEANDDLVGRCSAHFGRVIRNDFRMNHLDEVNQLFDPASVFETSRVDNQLFLMHRGFSMKVGVPDDLYEGIDADGTTDLIRHNHVFLRR